MRIQITLKSGAQVEFDAETFTTKKNGLGELASLEWTTPADFTAKLVRVNVDEIAAIVRLGGPDE